MRFMAHRLIAGGLTRRTKFQAQQSHKINFLGTNYINIQLTDFLTERVPVQPQQISRLDLVTIGCGKVGI